MMWGKSVFAQRWDERLRKVQTNVDLPSMEGVLRRAADEGRATLFEHEVYQFLKHLGSETPPRTLLLPVTAMPDDEELMSMPGDKVVLKIVSPTIVHKTEVGGVRIVPKEPDKIRATCRRMLYEVSEKYATLIERHPASAPEKYRGLSGDALLTAISLDIVGVLLVQFMPPDSDAFGNELIVGLRNTREFGMVLTAGLGGTDTELYAEHFRKDRALVSAATANLDGITFFELFTRTVSYKKLAGLTRSQTRMVTDEQLVECFSALIKVANHFSPHNPEAPFVIDELEVNPFAFSDYSMVPLDGLCAFSEPKAGGVPRPIAKIDALLHPKSIGIIGASPTRMNFGRIILNNIIKAGFSPDDMCCIHPTAQSVDGVCCVAGLDRLEAPLDFLVVAVGADMVPDLVDQVVEGNAAQSVLLIPGGLGETEESRERADEIIAKIAAAHTTQSGGPVFCGGNSMGIISHPGRYDTWFLSEEKLPKQRGTHHRNMAFISQSGAFMGTRVSQWPSLDPAYLVSVGNQTDLTLGDFMAYFKDRPDVDVIGVYAEGFNDLDGLAFARSVRAAVNAGKEVVFYKAGRTPEGRLATSGHTASLAGDYTVCEACLTQAGAMVAKNIGQFEDLLRLASRLHGKPIAGNRIAGFSSAGFEAVAIADYVQTDDYQMQLAEFSPATQEQLTELVRRKRLENLVTVKNPLDINPGADDEVFASVIRLLDKDSRVDAVVAGLVPITPAMHSLITAAACGVQKKAEGTPDALGASCDCNAPEKARIVDELDALRSGLRKPLVLVVDGGRIFDPFKDALESLGFPVFRCVDRAMEALSLYIKARLTTALGRR
ncbi:MAG: acetate--CoA ligase family protein [Halodesulfovibrio sp.]